MDRNIILISILWLAPLVNSVVLAQTPDNTTAGVSELTQRPETVTVLTNLYKAEIAASRNYDAFALQAEKEEIPSVAKLFTALKESEAIHARNFKNLLTNLEVPIEEIGEYDIPVKSSRRNLKFALKVELAEIDGQYPAYIEQIQPEEYQDAINDITYAWKAEQQHRDLIKKMLSATGMFFTDLVEKLDEADNYYICQRCGSTMTQLPDHVCPICGAHHSEYRQVAHK